MQVDQAAILALCVWALKEVYEAFRGDSKGSREKIVELQVALARLEAQLAFLNQNLAQVHKLNSDVNALWQYLRKINGEPRRGESES